MIFDEQSQSTRDVFYEKINSTYKSKHLEDGSIEYSKESEQHQAQNILELYIPVFPKDSFYQKVIDTILIACANEKDVCKIKIGNPKTNISYPQGGTKENPFSFSTMLTISLTPDSKLRDIVEKISTALDQYSSDLKKRILLPGIQATDTVWVGMRTGSEIDQKHKFSHNGVNLWTKICDEDEQARNKIILQLRTIGINPPESWYTTLGYTPPTS